MFENEKKKKRVEFIINMVAILLVLIGIGLFASLFHAHANEGKGIKDYWYPTPTIDQYCLGRDKCDITPTASPTPTYASSVTPTATPSVAPLPTSDGTSGGSGGGSSLPGSTTNAPGAVTCNIAFSAPVITSITAGQSGTLNITWLESDQNINKFSIIYGLVGQPLNMGVDNLPGNYRGYVIGLLSVGSSINAQVWSWKNGCAEKSNIVDPVVR